MDVHEQLCVMSLEVLWLLTIKETNPGQKKYIKINAAQEMLPLEAL